MTTIEQVIVAAAAITDRRRERAEATTILAFVRPLHGPRAVYVASATQPGKVYRVTGAGCTCQSYQQRGWCRHADRTILALAARHQQQASGALVTMEAAG